MTEQEHATESITAAPATSNTPTSNKRTFAALCAIVGIDGLSYALVLPLLPFTVRELGGGTIEIAISFGAFSICQLVAAPLLGRWSDRRGRRAVLLASQAGTAIGFVVLAGAHAIWVLVLARVIDGATAGNLAVVNATVCDDTDEHGWTERFSVLNAASGAGLLVGLLICAALTGAGLAVVAAVALSASLVTIGLTACTPFPTTRRARPNTGWLELLRQRPAALRWAAGTLLTAQVLMAAFAVVLPVLLHDGFGFELSTSVLIGAVALAVGGGVQAVAASGLSRRFEDRVIALGAFVAAGIGVGLLGAGALCRVGVAAGTTSPVATTLATFGTVVVVCGVLLALSAATALMGKADPELGAGSVMGLSQAVGSVGQLAGPPLGFLALIGGPALFCGALLALAITGAMTTSSRNGSNPR